MLCDGPDDVPGSPTGSGRGWGPDTGVSHVRNRAGGWGVPNLNVFAEDNISGFMAAVNIEPNQCLSAFDDQHRRVCFLSTHREDWAGGGDHLDGVTRALVASAWPGQH